MVYMIDLLNIVVGDMGDVYHESWTGVTSVYEDLKLKFFPYNNNREQMVARDSSSHTVCGIQM